MSSASLLPGFMALHGNRTEWLLDAVARWIETYPLEPLETEIFLVQNNGMGEWIRMGLASRTGVCAATQFRLPARFQWWLYRQVLGRDAIPEQSPLDKDPLLWRLMRLLGELMPSGALPGDDWAPLRGFLGAQSDEPTRRYQLALRIADLFDQYQVHRPDWLDAWAQGLEVLINATGARQPVPAEQRWQCGLWQRLLAELPEEARGLTRSALQRRVLDRLRAVHQGQSTPASAGPTLTLPRRLVVFGITHLPSAMLELLGELSLHCQVMLAIPNPCRYHWADIIDGRELLEAKRRRHPLRQERDLSRIALEQMHEYAHPLLAGWGRQARDFVRQLDRHDDVEQARRRFALQRFDVFTETLPDDASLLRQVQQHIADMTPLKEHPKRLVLEDDRSIVFQVAHGPVRELEILHDQLLLLLAEPARPGQERLKPRDIVVMVPDIDAFAPLIRAVFSQYGVEDRRYIPFDIADLRARGSSPLIAAIDWLLNIKHHRIGLPDLAGLLSVPAIAARLEVTPEGLAHLTRWMEESGIRWGLDARHRAELDLGPCGELNSIRFGLRRMLMGFASGVPPEAIDPAPPFAGIEAYGEVGGLEAGAVGALAELVDILDRWRLQCRDDADPATWGNRLRALLASLVMAVDETDRQTLAALDDSLQHWLEQCALAGYSGRLPLAVVGQVWLDALERPSLGRRFRAGGVTFCTLTPMRAIPFEVVCLLGMNEQDFPRRRPGNDFDLINEPGQRRPGDRARRDDDRQLMLEALLSARRVFYLSWSGRSARDNSDQPASVLVTQLQDYLRQGWGKSVVEQRTTVHPLQPFSRRYFEGNPQLATLAVEWRRAHQGATSPASGAVSATSSPSEDRLVSQAPLRTLKSGTALTIARLTQFLRNPVKAFFQNRLQVRFDDALPALPDLEPFRLHALERHAIVDELSACLLAGLADRPPETLAAADLPALIEPLHAQLVRSGRLPIGGPSQPIWQGLREELEPMIAAWCRTRASYPRTLERRAICYESDGVILEDWLEQRIGARNTENATEALWCELRPSRLLHKASGRPKAQGDKLIESWIRSLLASASGIADRGLLIGKDAMVQISSPATDEARSTLSTLLHCWREGQDAPLPVAPRTALAWLEGKGDPREPAARAYEGDDHNAFGEVEETCLARCFADFDELSQDGRFEIYAHRIYGPLERWISHHTQPARLTTTGIDEVDP